MRRVLIVLILAVVGGWVASAQPIIVARAADLNYALTELAHQFERRTGHKVTLSFGASGNLFSQILNPAPVDLYFSADEEYPKNLVVAQDPRRFFSENICDSPPGALCAKLFARSQ